MAKYVLRFNPDYNCTSLWPEDEEAIKRFDLGPIDYEDLELSKDLIVELEKFDESVMTILDWNNPGGPSPLSKAERLAIYDNGKVILEKVRKELYPDYEVIDQLDWVKTE